MDIFDEYAQAKRSGLSRNKTVVLPVEDTGEKIRGPRQRTSLEKEIENEDYLYLLGKYKDLEKNYKRTNILYWLIVLMVIVGCSIASYLILKKPEIAIKAIEKANVYATQTPSASEALRLFFEKPLDPGEERSIAIKSTCGGKVQAINYGGDIKKL